MAAAVTIWPNLSINNVSLRIVFFFVYSINSRRIFTHTTDKIIIQCIFFFNLHGVMNTVVSAEILNEKPRLFMAQKDYISVPSKV